MFDISKVVNKMTEVMDGIKTPAPTLPATMLKCTAMQRSGLSAYKTTAKIIEMYKKMGIPTEPNPDGSPNLIIKATYAIVKGIYTGVKKDGKVSTAIPMQSLLIQVLGGNAGGPVTSTGTNLTDTIASGTMQ